jgi:carbamate kinase
LKTTAPWKDGGGPPVVAFGGNALLPDARDTGGAAARAAEFAEAVLSLMPDDTGMVLVHGNGPQVGASLIRVEAARTEVPPSPLDVLVAETQGSIGYLLSRALRNALSGNGMKVEVATIVTQVVVDPADPAMHHPTKPVGPFYDPAEGSSLEADRGWRIVDVPGKGVRRVVASPPPIEVIEIDAVVRAAAKGRLVISGGGGGIPVERQADGALRGVEAVIDKDRTASLIARSIDARGLVILTEVPHASTAFGTPNERPLREMTSAQALGLLASGEFPPGSMGPKVEACIAYTLATRRPALITSVAGLSAALERDDGTWVVP